MIRTLRGTVLKGEPPMAIIDVGGVGYEVQCAAGLWENLQDGNEGFIHTYTYVREDRLELFGFGSAVERGLFIHFLDIPGVGPRIALQLCSVPVDFLCHAVSQEDARSLAHIKGIGKKMSEKILLELKALAEKGVLRPTGGSSAGMDMGIDEDALTALVNLGYDRRTSLQRLGEVPRSARSTEERVKYVLQSL